MDTKKLIEERGKKYGNAWKLTGSVLRYLLPQMLHMIEHNSKIAWPWLMIMNKLIRALKTPLNVDHWRDIQGYAQLVLDDLENKDEIPSK